MSILAICSKRRQKKVETPKLSLKVTTVGNCLGDQRRISCCEGSRFFVSDHLFLFCLIVLYFISDLFKCISFVLSLC